jgi:hypothetical protein
MISGWRCYDGESAKAQENARCFKLKCVLLPYSHVPRIMDALLEYCCVSCIDESDHSQTVSTEPDTLVADGSAKSIRDGSVALQMDDELPSSAPSTPFSIDSAKVVEDTLQLELSYGGCCKDRVLAAFWLPSYLKTLRQQPKSLSLMTPEMTVVKQWTRRSWRLI